MFNQIFKHLVAPKSNINRLIRFSLSYKTQSNAKSASPMNKSKSSRSNDDENAPIKYMASPASKWRAETSRMGFEESNRLWYEPYVIMASLTVFMVYFCVLREENYIDQELNKTLYQRIQGLEEQQLESLLVHHENRGLDTKEIESRLNDIKNNKT